MQGGERVGAECGADEEPCREPGESGGDCGEEKEGEGAGLQNGQVLGQGCLEGRPPEPRYVEDLLDGDGPTGQPHHEQAHVGHQPGQTPPYGLPRDPPPGQPPRGRGPHPRLPERPRQQIIQQPPEHGPGRQPERERRQHHPPRPVPPERRQPPELHPDDGGEHGRDEELGKRGEHGGAGASGVTRT